MSFDCRLTVSFVEIDRAVERRELQILFPFEDAEVAVGFDGLGDRLGIGCRAIHQSFM